MLYHLPGSRQSLQRPGLLRAVFEQPGRRLLGRQHLGRVRFGKTGGPDNAGYDTPHVVSGITDAISVTSGYNGSYCAVLSTGVVECWGYNGRGELGNGTVGGPDGEDGYDAPQAVTGITNAVSVASDELGYCAVLSTGGVDCWGANPYGELGNGTTRGPDGEDGYDTPQTVTGITDTVSVPLIATTTPRCCRQVEWTVGASTKEARWATGPSVVLTEGVTTPPRP